MPASAWTWSTQFDQMHKSQSSKHYISRRNIMFEYTIHWSRLNSSTSPWQFKEKLKKEPKKTTAIEGNAKSEAPEGDETRRRKTTPNRDDQKSTSSVVTTQFRKSSSSILSCSPKDRRLERLDTTRRSWLPPPPNPPQKPPFLVFFPCSPEAGGWPRTSRTREKGGILLGEQAISFCNSGFSESLWW